MKTVLQDVNGLLTGLALKYVQRGPMRATLTVDKAESRHPSQSGSAEQSEITQADDALMRQFVHKVITSASFSKAPRLSGFLQYICEKTINGDTDEINEQQIGVHVFGRAAGYNPGDDNIVRGAARSLRQRLALYYQEEGREDLLRITVPKGGYIPLFEVTRNSPTNELPDIRPELDAPADSPADPKQASTGSKGQSNIRLGPLPIATLFLAVVGVAVGLYGHSLRSTPSEKLWASLFTRERKTLIVPGDAGLNIYVGMAGRQVPVEEYVSGSYLSRPDAQTPIGLASSPLPPRRYTTMTDLNLAVALVKLPQAAADRPDIRYARDLQFNDLRESNVILIGPPPFNPWVQIFQKKLNFHFDWDASTNRFVVTNTQPQSGESATYIWSASASKGYARLALTDNLHATGRVLIVEGTTNSGVDAARDFLMNPTALDQSLAVAVDMDHRLHNFELLLETSFINGNSVNTKVIATRVY